MSTDFSAYLMLNGGSVYSGYFVGKNGVAVAELCFTTGISGYQHSISDPSFAHQIIVFTFPHVGNIGVNKLDSERKKIFTTGIVLRNNIAENEHYLKCNGFDEWLKENNIVGIYGIDTRKLTRHIVLNGAMNAIICPNSLPKHEAKKRLEQFPNMLGMELTQEVSHHVNTLNTSVKERKYKDIKIAIIDFGAKNSIISCMEEYFTVCIVPAAKGMCDEILKNKVDGIILSNGPGDPAATAIYATEEINKIIALDIPILGICLGHQLLALALGCKTYKLQHAHRGINQPVYNVKEQRIEISSQNHGFVVEEDSIPDNVVVTHYSLFDGCIEGLKVKDKPIFSVQYHPESSPGPNDSKYIFKQFADEVIHKKYGHPY